MSCKNKKCADVSAEDSAQCRKVQMEMSEKQWFKGANCKPGSGDTQFGAKCSNFARYCRFGGKMDASKCWCSCRLGTGAIVVIVVVVAAVPSGSSCSRTRRPLSHRRKVVEAFDEGK
jgi:hypothetical protein